MSTGMNRALAYIRENLTQPFSESDLAAIASQTPSAFSRSFRKHTGMSLLQYIKRLRINLACQILMSDERAQISDICFEVGFNNLSNFNRQFLAEKGMPPSQFRRLVMDNLVAGARGLTGGHFDRHLNKRGRDCKTGQRQFCYKLPWRRRKCSNIHQNSRRSRPGVAFATSGGTIARAADISGSTVAFLMPDQGSTRYEEHDHPGLHRRDEEAVRRPAR